MAKKIALVMGVIFLLTVSLGCAHKPARVGKDLVSPKQQTQVSKDEVAKLKAEIEALKKGEKAISLSIHNDKHGDKKDDKKVPLVFLSLTDPEKYPILHSITEKFGKPRFQEIRYERSSDGKETSLMKWYCGNHIITIKEGSVIRVESFNPTWIKSITPKLPKSPK